MKERSRNIIEVIDLVRVVLPIHVSSTFDPILNALFIIYTNKLSS